MSDTLEAAMPADTAPAADLLGLFPPGSHLDADGELVVGGCRLTDLAAAWGTPLYVLDDEAVADQVRRFRQALESSWPDARMVWASKSFPCTAVYRLMAAEGIGVDVAGGGELVMALAGGVDPARIVMHGNAKTTAELTMATEAGVGLIVIDNFDDIDKLEALPIKPKQPVLIRVIPDVKPDTHEAVATGQAGSKFGLPVPAARAAIERVRRGVPLQDPSPGDLVAVAVTGAYCYTLTSNYNGARRPPVVFCQAGRPRLQVRRETYDDLLARDASDASDARGISPG
jgi:diaminopimelate decarboxylase